MYCYTRKQLLLKITDKYCMGFAYVLGSSVGILGMICAVLLFFGGVDSRRLGFPGFREASSESVDNGGRYNWAVLVAGSKGFSNYRHQADVCHAYQVLKANGMPDDHIITMVYDDIAHNVHQKAKHKGALFNRPGGPNVYEGCAKDYTGQNVTAAVFYAVLSGNKNYVDGVGSGCVVESGPRDNIFVYYSDHGASGIIGMPTGGYIYADSLTQVLVAMHMNKRFKEMVIYMEACESGSMFENLLPTDIGVYALSASNSTESSWATYCPDYSSDSMDKRGVTASSVGACLGDLFSVSWMEDTEASNTGDETLLTQFTRVHKRTAATGDNDYAGSEVLQFGDLVIDKETTNHFEASRSFKEEGKSGADFVAKFPHLSAQDPLVLHANRLPFGSPRVKQRDADLVFYMHAAMNAESKEESDVMLSELRKMVSEREEVDKNIRRIIGSLTVRHNLYHHTPLLTAALDLHVVDHEGRFGAGKPFVDDWSCLRGMVENWEKHCGELSDYSMKYARAFASLCNIGVKVDDFSNVSKLICSRERLKVGSLFQEIAAKTENVA